MLVSTWIVIFIGKLFNIVAIPWAYHLIADKIPESDPEWQPNNQYRNFW